MSGLDSGKATKGPANDGLGVAKQDSPWGGTETASASDAVATEPAVVDAPAVRPARAISPWHLSRPRRPLRHGATAPGTRAALGLAGRIARAALARIVLPPRMVWAPWLGGALALLWLGGTALHPVGAQEQAIVATFGAAGPTLGPGLAVSWPWPIGSVQVEDVTSVRHLAVPQGDEEQVLLTRDAALVDLAYDVRWRIRDLRSHALGSADSAEALRLAAETAMRATVAGTDFGALTGAGRDTLGPEAARRLQALLDRDQAGITIDGIDIRRADPPAHVADAFRSIATARNAAATEATEAQSWARQLIVHAQIEASAFDKIDAQYRLAPEVTRREMYYATMEHVLTQADKVIVGAPGGTLPSLAAPAADAPASRARAGNGH